MGEVPLIGFVGLLVGLIIGMTGVYVLARLRAQTARALAEQIIANAHREAETTRRQAELAAREESLRRREELEAEIESLKRSLREHERRLEKRSDLLDQKLELLTQKESEIAAGQRAARRRARGAAQAPGRAQAESLRARSRRSRASRGSRPMRRDELLLKRVEDELAAEVGNLVLKYQAMAQESCQQKGREILATTIQRYAAAHTAEVTVSTVDIPSDDMKGGSSAARGGTSAPSRRRPAST